MKETDHGMGPHAGTSQAVWGAIGDILQTKDRRIVRRRIQGDDLTPKNQFLLRTIDALVPVDDQEHLEAALEVWRWLDDLSMCADADQAYNNLVDVIVMGPLTAGEILILLSFADLLPSSEDTEFSRQSLRSLPRLLRCAPEMVGGGDEGDQSSRLAGI